MHRSSSVAVINESIFVSFFFSPFCFFISVPSLPIESGNYFSFGKHFIWCRHLHNYARLDAKRKREREAERAWGREMEKEREREREKWKLSEKDFQMNGNSFKSYSPLFLCNSAPLRVRLLHSKNGIGLAHRVIQSSINKTTNANVNWTSSTVAAAEVRKKRPNKNRNDISIYSK